MEIHEEGNHPLFKSRRKFVTTAAGAVSALPFLSQIPAYGAEPLPTDLPAMEKSIIGGYGPWASSLIQDPPALSFRRKEWKKLDAWKPGALQKAKELLSAPRPEKAPGVRTEKKYVFEGLEIEEISWQLPYGRRTEAIVLKPAGATGKLPAILALHDHGGKKYFGKSKITRTAGEMHPLVRQHQESDYGGRAWANEMAAKGYVVLVHDTYAFGSRRVHYEDMEGISWGALKSGGKTDRDIVSDRDIQAYNTWAGEHESVMAKSLFCAGTTWPGVVLSEDQAALSVLASRPDVDAGRLGCGGLSGGGLRTVYLAGLDPRVKCAVCVGFMTTWKDLLLSKSFTHTWMTFAPLLPAYLEFPEILGLRVPLPVLVQNNNQDGLYTLSGMKQADDMLSEVYRKAGAAGRYEGRFYDGPHKFDVKMQEEAFAWFDRWLS